MTYTIMKGVRILKQSDINRLIDLHGKKLYNFCLRLCANTYDAEDLYQDTFIKAFEKISAIDENNNPSAYLCTVAISLWKSKARKEVRRQAIAPTVTLEESYHTAQSTPLEEDVVKTELVNDVKRAISSLDEKLRTCMLLHYIYDMQIGDIARTLNCPEGTVKSRLHSARKIIKEKLAKGEL